jgi:hypothetical protein
MLKSGTSSQPEFQHEPARMKKPSIGSCSKSGSYSQLPAVSDSILQFGFSPAPFHQKPMLLFRPCILHGSLSPLRRADNSSVSFGSCPGHQRLTLNEKPTMPVLDQFSYRFWTGF